MRQQLLDIIHRTYDHQLMISTEGVASIRVDAESFLITPTGLDRLEVAEYSAQALIDTATIGPLIPIGQDDTSAIEKVFDLS